VAALQMGSTPIGQKLAHYNIIRKLGSGGMGDVYLAHDTVLGRSVALKVLSARADEHPDRARRFVSEAKAASALNHPNIATVHELGSAGGVHFIVMEYVDGETLKARVSRGPLDSAEIASLALQIAGALDAAHSAGIIHRDVKSSNIVVTPRGHAKVLDFGLAKRTMFAKIVALDVINEATESGVVLGTVSYMSPEQAMGEKLDHRSDFFSLGIVLYEMATGRLPFPGHSAYEVVDQIVRHDPASVQSINPRVSGSLERLIGRCLQKKPDDRFQSAAELIEDLRQSETVPEGPARRIPPRNNLPQQLTRFIGRGSEIAEIRESLRRTRLLTLCGPGGIGKTRLALEAATQLPGNDDGVWFVEFASLADPGLVPHTVASTLGVGEERGRSITDTVVDYLKDRRLLLVLDNCEHLIAACARLADRVLRTSATVRVLATSREPLGIDGEPDFRVPSLSVPDPGQPHDVESVS